MAQVTQKGGSLGSECGILGCQQLGDCHHCRLPSSITACADSLQNVRLCSTVAKQGQGHGLSTCHTGPALADQLWQKTFTSQLVCNGQQMQHG